MQTALSATIRRVNLMLRHNNIEVAWVPRAQVRPALQVYRDHVFAVKDIDEAINLADLINSVIRGETRMGVAYQVEPFEPLGCWFSDLQEEDEIRYATIFGLSGKSPNKWASGIGKLLELWAKEENCYSYRWYGRLGWTKFAQDIKLLKSLNDREGLFEKVVGP